MQQFRPPRFGQRAIATPLGVMAYVTNADSLPTTDAPPLVFLHSLGGGSSSFEWSKCYPGLSDHPIFAPDLVGWGQSAHPAHDYTPADYFAQFQALLESVPNGPAIVFAASLTGGLMVRFALQRPDLVRALVLVCPAGYSDFGESYAQSPAAQLTRVPGLKQLVYNVGAANDTAVRSFLQRFLFARSQRITDEMVAAYTASAQQPNAEYSALSTLRGDLSFDLARYFPQLQTPTLLIWGEQAWFSTLARGRRLAALNPQAVKGFEAIAQTGVLPHLEAPEAVLAIVRAYLDSGKLV